MAISNSAELAQQPKSVTVRIRRFEPGDKPAIDRLNARFEAGGIQDRVWAESESTPAEARGDAMTQQLFVAADGHEIRGGVWLHQHNFTLRGELIRAGWLKYPVAESLIDRAYGGVPAAMLLTVMRQQPEIMALGMGSPTTPFAQLLAALGWTIKPIPFFVMPTRPARVLKHLPQLRKSAKLQGLATVLAHTGLPTVAASPLNVARALKTSALLRGVQTELVSEFGDWADETWVNARDCYGFIARRDAAMLNLVYRPNYPRLSRLRIKQNNVDIGWVCTTMAEPSSASAKREFGELKVGLLADALGRPEAAATLTAAGVNYLVEQGADLVVTNRINSVWRAPLRSLGFIGRPTNFFFAYSKKMAARIDPLVAADEVYLNRGDCDGPPQWW